jgi:hypothetical protein
VRSLLVLGLAAAVFALHLARNAREAQALVREEDRAIDRILALVEAPPGPPRVEDGYRFAWATGAGLPAVLLAFPDGAGVCLFAAVPGAVYAFELFDDPPPDVTPLRIHVAKSVEGAPPGWRKVR